MTTPGKPRISRRLAGAAALAAFAAATLAAILFFDTPPAANWEEKVVTIPKGSRLPEVISRMEEGGVLRHPLTFRALAVLTSTDRKLQYGEYIFPKPLSTFGIWNRIRRGDAKGYEITVLPGSNIYDVAAAIQEKKLGDPEAFLAAATAPAVMNRLEIPGESAEGYLYPETYNFHKPITPEEILEEMVRMFRKNFTPAMERRAKERSLSLHQVVTIASIIEKETGLEEEKPLVSAVIRRRLALGMPLQMDPTVIYGIKRFDGTVTRKDLRTPGPYNSYLNRGLPPGPIANPGMSAVLAALSPAEADYLYFVSRNDGSHTFSRTLQEHNQAVEEYRAAREKEPDEATPQPPPSGPS